MSNQTYKAAIIGLGNIAWKYDKNSLCQTRGPQTHASAYRQCSDIVLAGGCSPEKSDRESFANNYKADVFDNVEELLKRTRPDIVSICSPSNLHFQHALKCIEAGIPMLWLEKPPVLSTEELKQLIKQQAKNKTTILVNFQRRYQNSYNKLKEIYANKVLGQTVLVRLTYSRGLLLNGSHIIDMLFYVLGDDDLPLESVLPFGDVDNPSFCLRSSSGLGIIVEGSSLPYHNIDIELTCENGRVSVLYGGMHTRIEKRVEHELFPGFYRLKEKSSGLSDKETTESTMVNALDDLIASCHAKKQPKSNLISSGKTLAIIEKVQQAMGTK